MLCCPVLFYILKLGLKSHSATYWPGVATAELHSDKTGKVEKVQLKEENSTCPICLSLHKHAVLFQPSRHSSQSHVYFQCLCFDTRPHHN